MTYDETRIVAAVPALRAAFGLSGGRSCTVYDVDLEDRLHAQGLVEDHRGKAKPVAPAPEGLARGERAAQRPFGAPAGGSP